MIDSKKYPFFLRLIKKETGLLILMKKLYNSIETKEKNRFF